MKHKVREKEKAVHLRKKGLSYNDILKEIPVAKSTLSEWLKDLPLTKEEKQSLKKRTNAKVSKGRIRTAAALRRNRINRDRVLFEESQKEFRKFAKDPFFFVGIALYWAEGSKRNSYFSFSNSDPAMILLMIRWIERFLYVPRKDLNLRLYIHKPYGDENCEEFWAEYTQIPITNFRKTIYKPTGLLIKKRPEYKGCLRVSITKIKFLRKLAFWQNMLVEYYDNT